MLLVAEVLLVIGVVGTIVSSVALIIWGVIEVIEAFLD